MIYPYYCKPCDNTFEVIKAVAQIDAPETCTSCGSVSTDRRIGLPRLGVVEVEPQFNPAFGKVIRNKSHLRSELSRLRDQGKEMVEIGDECPNKLHRKFASERKEKRAKRWSEPVEKQLQEVMHGR